MKLSHSRSKTVNRESGLTAITAVGSGALLGVRSTRIITHLFQKLLGSLFFWRLGAGHYNCITYTTRPRHNLWHTIILACCFIQPLPAKPIDISLDAGALVSHALESVTIKSEHIVRVLKPSEQNIHASAEQSATLGSVGTESKPMPKPHGEQSQDDGICDWHWLIVICILSLFVGYQITGARTPNEKS